MTIHRGPVLPYSIIAGVTPWLHGWVVASAKIHGTTIGPEPPRVYESFDQVLGERPSFDIIVVNAPIGYVDGPIALPRTCDKAARALLGRRGSAIHNPPPRDLLAGKVEWYDAGLDVVTAMLLPRYVEVSTEMSPFRQRTVFEGHPELSFFQLNRDSPLSKSKNIVLGREERVQLLESRLPGADAFLNPGTAVIPSKHLFDSIALLWTARRTFARAAHRLPLEPEWDSEGLRMEFVY